MGFDNILIPDHCLSFYFDMLHNFSYVSSDKQILNKDDNTGNQKIFH